MIITPVCGETNSPVSAGGMFPGCINRLLKDRFLTWLYSSGLDLLSRPAGRLQEASFPTMFRPRSGFAVHRPANIPPRSGYMTHHPAIFPPRSSFTVHLPAPSGSVRARPRPGLAFPRHQSAPSCARKQARVRDRACEASAQPVIIRAGYLHRSLHVSVEFQSEGILQFHVALTLFMW